MIAMLSRWKDQLLGRGDAAITVPVFDGALKSNRLIEDARVVAALEAPEDVTTDGRAVFVADGARVLRLNGDRLEEVHRCAGSITALACLPDGGFAIAIEGKEIRVEGGAHHGRQWSAIGAQGFNAVNAITVGRSGRLLVTDGSRERSYGQWKHDLMGLGHSGRVFELTPADGGGRMLAEGLHYAFGACEAGDELWVSESWRHHVIRLAGGGKAPLQAVTDALPGYPSRIAPASDGGAWLTCFALRTQLVEFVLREPAYRVRMMAEIAPEHWIAPALNSGNTFLEPMQGAQLKMMGIVKPWAPPHSYGLVVRLDERGLVRYSLHSRFDGKNHGIAAAAACGDTLYLVAKGNRRLLALDIASAQRELVG